MLHREAPIDNCRCLQQDLADQPRILGDTEWEIAMSEHGLIAERDLALCEKFVQATPGWAVQGGGLRRPVAEGGR
jgi:hypothetical protein